jgi:hypothetical protein
MQKKSLKWVEKLINPRIAIKGLTLFSLLFAITALSSGIADAKSTDLANFIGKYGDLAISNCTLCHPDNNTKTFNEYGTAYKGNGRSTDALTLIESHDSDQDNFTNIEEINAQTYPGDAGSVPDVAANVPPAAYAGPDQDVNAGATVTLDGSGSSDSDGTIVGYSWTQTDGTTVTLAKASTVNPTFTAPNISETLTFELTVTDDRGATATDFVYVNVFQANKPPVADAGADQTVSMGDTVTLDGSGSHDVDGDQLTMAWSFVSVPEGSSATLSNSTLVNPNFVADLPGTYVVHLTVNDGMVDSAPDTVTISMQNSVPVANAGPDQSVLVWNTVTLDGSGSHDVDGDQLAIAWSFVSIPAGSSATLSNSTEVNPTFDVDLPGTYVVQLTVNDGMVDSAPDRVTISTQNTAPVANAGPDQSVFVGDTVTLDGSGSSDPDGDALTFNWSFVSRPAGSGATLADTTAVQPSFTVDLPGTYVAQLIVKDAALDIASNTVTISTENSAPVADAGDAQTAHAGETVTLDGSGSQDADGDPLTFVWSFVSVPTGSTATLSDPTAVNPTFVADVLGIYVIQLIVNDSKLDSSPDTVSISTGNSAPVAEAGKRQNARVGDTITLDGSRSTDSDGDPLTFSWSFASRPEGSIAKLSDPASPAPTFAFVPDFPGTYVVQLIVNDGTLNSDPDTCIVKVRKQNHVGGKGGGKGNAGGKVPASGN